MTSAPYIDVKRFAVHDGPGIRTTLFLKGCTLKCIWCHNPESIAVEKVLAIHFPKCTSCGSCANICPLHFFDEKNIHHFKREDCRKCGRCVGECPAGALELAGKKISVEDAATLLLEDRIFYQDGGGITLSGGEALLHKDFCKELLEIMQQEKIHCAVDTCGNVPWQNFEEVLPFTDMFLYDFKCADAEKHRRFTGKDNLLIRENLKRLSSQGKDIEIRMLMVPEHNMEDADLMAAGEELSRLENITAVRLLPYHSFARNKFLAVGMPDTMPHVISPDENMLESAAEILRKYGLKVINSLKD